MFKFVLPIFLIFLCEQGLAQERFIAVVTEYVRGNFSGAVARCPGTIITDRHVLTTAACATPTNDSFLLGIRINFDFGGGAYGSTETPAERAFIHPDYNGDIFTNNVAVVLIDGKFNATTLPPRRLGSIPFTSTTCTLFGFGGAALYPDTVEVVAYTPENCYSNHTQAYCSEHVPLTRACSASVGSPLVCNPQSVDGILLQTGCQEESPGRYLQPYHSVDEFREWIESVSGAVLVNQISTVLLLSALVIGLWNLV
ncbi:snake venom serine protease-like [Bradysia coprophila]|uniref:snake venom serine protease-like n=1 Tax=Bradysia coprophila TaxID=38358 RepID=UPI00187D9D1D|nr:snake venom serine protease-like [Bradysia coprophila]